MQGIQESENDTAEIVIVCEPEGNSLQMGGLHPRASLYEKPVNLDAAKKAHAEFRRVMRERGVRVLTVREILAYGVEHHVGARVELEDFAVQVSEAATGAGRTERPRGMRRREGCEEEGDGIGGMAVRRMPWCDNEADVSATHRRLPRERHQRPVWHTMTV